MPFLQFSRWSALEVEWTDSQIINLCLEHHNSKNYFKIRLWNIGKQSLAIFGMIWIWINKFLPHLQFKSRSNSANLFWTGIEREHTSYCFGSPHCDVKDVAAHRTGHSHVPQALSCHNHTGDEVRDGGTGCQDGQSHNLLRDANCLTHLHNKQNCHLVLTKQNG